MPFLDVRLIELMFTVRGDALFADGFTKRVLRESFADVLPAEVRLRRDKIGFYTPLASWLRAHGDWIAGFMSVDRLHEAGLLRADRYRASLTALRSGQDATALEVWRGLIVHLWIDRFAVAGLSAEPTAA
jgi:asparagine synthase (glutamine-hydrolysing)